MDLGPSDNPTPDYDALLSRASSITGTPVKKRQPDDTRVKSILDRMRGGESGQESGGNTTATNPDSGAIGQFQVMPSNVPAWTRLHYGQSLTPEQFKDNPKAQQAVFNGQMGSYIKKALPLAGGDEDKAIRMAAAAWYGPGEKAFRLYDNPKPQTYNGKTYPSFREYTTNVLNKSKSSQPFDYAGLLKRADEITGDQTDYQGLIKRANDITGPPATAPSPTFASPILPTPTAQPVVNTPSLAGNAPPVESLMPTTQPQTQSVSPSQPTPYAPPSDNLITQPVTNQAATPQYSDADFSAWAKSKGVPKTAMSRAAFEAELKTVQNPQPAPAQTPNANAPQVLQPNAQARPQGANPQISTPPVTNVQPPTQYGTSEPQIVDTQDAFTPEEQAKIAASQPTTVPAIATVNVNPNASDEDKARSAANQVLVGRSTPTGPITPQDIDNWINLAKSRLPQDPHALFVGDRGSNTYSIFPNMLDQIQEMKKKSPEQLAEELKQRVIAAPTDDELRQRAIDELSAQKRGQSTLALQSGQTPPVIRPTEDEIQAKIAEYKSREPSQEDKSAKYDYAQTETPLEAAAAQGFTMGGNTLAGVLRPISEAGSEWAAKQSALLGLESPYRNQGQGPKGVGENVVNFLGSSIPELGTIVALPGGPVAKFAFLGGAETAGRGGNISDIAQETAKGAATGGTFRAAEEFESPLAKLGTVFGGSAAVNAVSGMPIDQNLQNSIVNTLYEAQGIYGSKIAGKFFRFWQGGEPLTVGVTPKGEVILPKGDVKADGDVVLDPQNPVYKSANDVTNAPKQNETLKPIESNETNTQVPSQPASLDENQSVPAAEVPPSSKPVATTESPVVRAAQDREAALAKLNQAYEQDPNAPRDAENANFNEKDQRLRGLKAQQLGKPAGETVAAGDRVNHITDAGKTVEGTVEKVNSPTYNGGKSVEVRLDSDGRVHMLHPDEIMKSAVENNTEVPETRTVSHPNPDIDGKPVLTTTSDGRVVVENPENKSGVSIVTDRGEPEKGTEAAPREPSPEIKPELHAAYTKAFELPLIDRTQPSNRAKLARAVDVTYETESGKTITKKMTADARQKQIENKGKVLQKLLDCIHG